MRRLIAFSLITLFLSFCLLPDIALAADDTAVSEEYTEDDAEDDPEDSSDTEDEEIPGAIETKPLFEFDYGGKKIETYGSYSVVDGNMCTSHRFFVKNGKLTVIDQDLNPTATGVFIHYDDGKSYIMVLGEDGKAVSLGTEDELDILQNFKNKGISRMSENIHKDTSTVLFEYEDGSVAAYDCITGELIYEKGADKKEKQQSLTDFVKNFTSGFTSLFSGGTSGGTNATNAQNLINAMENSGMTMEQIAQALQDGNNDTGQYETTGETGSSEMSSVPEVDPDIDLTEEEKSKVNSFLLKVASGETTPEEAMEEMSKTMDLSEAQTQSISFQMKQVFDSRVESERAKAKEDARMFSKGSYGTSGLQTDGKSGTARENGTGRGDGTGMNIIDGKGEGDGTGDKASGAEAVDHQFIKSDLSEEYVAVYNAEEGRYDIYSAEDLLENPDGAEDEISKISDKTDLDTILHLLKNEKDDSSRRGILLYVGIALAICGIIASMIVFGRKKEIG